MTIDQLRKLSADQSINMAGLAAEAGISKYTIADYLSGRRGAKGINPKVQEKLLAALERLKITLDDVTSDSTS
jgi:transcriptional regulator with XRE-family HTH domain